MRRIAVIGAGIAGLTAAAALQAGGHTVTLFEKSRGPGGRCATRRSAVGPFDHGAPSFTAITPPFRAQVLAWRDAGWVACDNEPHSAATASVDAATLDRPLLAWGQPSMNALAQHLVAALPAGSELRADTHVASIEPGTHAATAWRLRLQGGALVTARFDAVVVAVPAEQAAALLAPDAAQAAAMRRTHSDPCWTVMAAWSDPLPAALLDRRSHGPHGVLSRAHRDETPSGGPDGEGVDSRWVLHATPEWSAQHLEAPAAEVISTLLAAWATPCHANLAAPSHAAAHRWRYAQVPAPQVEPFGWNAMLRLGACGDAWHAIATGRASADGIERAWLSGRALAGEMLGALRHD